MKRLMFIAVLSAFMAGPAIADLVSSTGAVNYIGAMPVPLDLRLDQKQSDTDIFVFDEMQNLTLASALSVDITSAGSYDQKSDLTPGKIPAGAVVNSYLIHVDPVDYSSGLVWYTGSITFSNRILGVITETKTLNDSDSVVGVGTTTYSTSTLRGLEWTNQDKVIVSISPDNMTMTLGTAEALDNIRVIEAPVPGAILLGLLGLTAAGVKLRRFA
jgi:hypothetical protein